MLRSVIKQPKGVASAIAMKCNDSFMTGLLSGKETMWKMASTPAGRWRHRRDLIWWKWKLRLSLSLGWGVGGHCLRCHSPWHSHALLPRSPVLLCWDGWRPDVDQQIQRKAKTTLGDSALLSTVQACLRFEYCSRGRMGSFWEWLCAKYHSYTDISLRMAFLALASAFAWSACLCLYKPRENCTSMR